jgi:hypothetical protein
MRTEELYQIAVVQYLRIRYPSVKFTISPITKLSIQQGAKQKRMGYTKGSPDLLIFAARRGFHGLLIELKSPGGRVSPEQKDWQEYLTREGYKAAVCFGSEEAISLIDGYLKG